MRKTYLSAALIWVISVLGNLNLFAQAIDTTMLCQGKYFTEAEGKAALEKFAMY